MVIPKTLPKQLTKFLSVISLTLAIIGTFQVEWKWMSYGIFAVNILNIHTALSGDLECELAALEQSKYRLKGV
jgi:hypothetical protein